jgi:hypothetical protein
MVKDRNKIKQIQEKRTEKKKQQEMKGKTPNS